MPINPPTASPEITKIASLMRLVDETGRYFPSPCTLNHSPPITHGKTIVVVKNGLLVTIDGSSNLLFIFLFFVFVIPSETRNLLENFY